jgi:hypothetical protein
MKLREVIAPIEMDLNNLRIQLTDIIKTIDVTEFKYDHMDKAAERLVTQMGMQLVGAMAKVRCPPGCSPLSPFSYAKDTPRNRELMKKLEKVREERSRLSRMIVDFDQERIKIKHAIHDLERKREKAFRS